MPQLHEGSSELGALLPMAVVRRRDETSSQAASRLPADGVLIVAGAWAGLDTPIRWASIVVPAIPFDRPTGLDEKVESRYIDSKNVALRRMRQVVGRGVRTPDARCTIFILDERYKRLGQFLPERFKDSWIEGGRDIDKLIAAERRRSLAIRPKALGHYGCKCYACDLVPPHQSIIDIHHLRPIAEGERQTLLEDVIPLCANCHRLAHTQEPPLPIDDLRKRNKSGYTPCLVDLSSVFSLGLAAAQPFTVARWLPRDPRPGRGLRSRARRQRR